MAKAILYSFICSAILFVQSCGTGMSSQRGSLEKEVLAMHDELMIKTEDLIKLRKELAKARLKTKGKGKRDQAKDVIVLINAAESFMEDWMRFYGNNKPEEKDDDEKAITFYTEQVLELVRMQEQMQDAEKEAKELLETMKGSND